MNYGPRSSARDHRSGKKKRIVSKEWKFRNFKVDEWPAMAIDDFLRRQSRRNWQWIEIAEQLMDKKWMWSAFRLQTSASKQQYFFLQFPTHTHTHKMRSRPNGQSIDVYFEYGVCACERPQLHSSDVHLSGIADQMISEAVAIVPLIRPFFIQYFHWM